VKALQGRRFGAYYFSTAEEAVVKALSLIPPEATVSWGGSETLNEIGLKEIVRKRHSVFDFDAALGNIDTLLATMRQSLGCDVFITSVNAISQDGQMVNVDHIGNRVAAMTFGPKRVIVIAGLNKVCNTLEEAVIRARTYASPINAVRIGRVAPCNVTGSCADCRSEECICSYIVTTRMNNLPDRVHVILVGQDLGM